MEENIYNITKKENNKNEIEIIENKTEKNTKKIKWNPFRLFCCINNEMGDCI